MNRIEAIFDRLRAAGDKALMPFLTAGDPDLATTGELLPVVEAGGGAICEVGFPFSDPIADGPVIQASMTRALDRGIRTRAIFEMVAQLRSKLSIGLVAMVSYSIVYRLGPRVFFEDCRAAGFDGVIIPDLPLEEGAQAAAEARAAGLICSFLISPTTPIERAQRIAKLCTGFIYLLSRAGLTGEQTSLPADLSSRIERLRSVTDLPIAVGFGISTPEQVAQVVEVADAAIVGSAIVRRIEGVVQAGAAGSDGGEHDRAAVVAEVASFVRELAGGLRGGS